VLGDSENTPSIQAKSLAMGQGYVSTGTARFQLDNGTVTLSGNIFMGFYVQNEAQSAVREVVVNGGSLTAEAVSGARLGYNNLTRGRHAFEVNGGTFTLNGPFDLTQLSPGGSKNNSLRESMKHTLTMNGGECSCTIFRMGYSYGLTWDNKLSDNNGYGHGWQPDAYLTMNGGTMTISDHLLAGDRRDSRSWTILNGGVLKVNMLTNTYATATAATDDGAANFIFNGGVYAPIGDGDVPDELVMKRLTTAVVSTNGAVFTTEHMPVGASFTVEQALVHDPLCGDDPDGGLTKAGAGRLVLAGANTFTGPLQVTGGTLAISAAGGVASKAAALSGDGVLELGEGVMLKLDSLEIDGEPSRNGIFGGAESHGNKLYAAHFAGKGVVQVGAVGTLLIFR
jgi:autotransporter-associated beta strand protein